VDISPQMPVENQTRAAAPPEKETPEQDFPLVREGCEKRL